MTGFLDGGVIEESSGYQIQRSLRLRDSATAYLSWTPGVIGSRTTWSWRGWVKRSKLGAAQGLFCAYATSTYWAGFYFTPADTLQLYDVQGGVDYGYVTSAVFRDPTAPMYVELDFDTTQVVAADRVKLRINGVSQAFGQNYGDMPQGYTGVINYNYEHRIGSNQDGGAYLGAYLSEVNFTSGHIPPPTANGQINPITGQWTAKKFVPVYGSELVTNGDFSAGIAGWNVDTVDWTVGAGTANHASGAVGNIKPSAAILTIGKYYTATYTVTSISAGGFCLFFGSGTQTATKTTPGTYTVTGLCAGDTNLYLHADATTVCSIDNISVREVIQGYGTNGFYLDFSDPTSATTLCYDRSGNSNNWTPNNISTTAGATYDSMLDVPLGGGGAERGNYCTWNPLAKASSTLSAGNLNATVSGVTLGTISTAYGKWYWEVLVTSDPSPGSFIGVADADDAAKYLFYHAYSGSRYIAGVQTGYGATYGATDTIGIALDADAKTVTFYKNNVSQGVLALSLIGTTSGNWVPATNNGSTPQTIACTFGQRPFAYTPPTGFKALHTGNLTSDTVTVSGSFTGNLSVDGPCIWLNGAPETLTINGNAVTWGTHADKLASGFKLRSSSASYNASGTNTWTATILSPSLKSSFRNQLAKGNP
jgi:hypothetical protein